MRRYYYFDEGDDKKQTHFTNRNWASEIKMQTVEKDLLKWLSHNAEAFYDNSISVVINFAMRRMLLLMATLFSIVLLWMMIVGSGGDNSCYPTAAAKSCFVAHKMCTAVHTI